MQVRRLYMVCKRGKYENANPITTKRFIWSIGDVVGRHMTYAHRRGLMQLSTTYIAWQMPPVVGRSYFPEYDIPWLMLPDINSHWCCPTDPHTPRLLRPAIGPHLLAEPRQPLIMLHNVGWCHCRPGNANTPQLLRAGLADTALPFPTLLYLLNLIT